MQIAADIGTSFFQLNELSKSGLGGFNSNNNLKSCEQHKILPESTEMGGTSVLRPFQNFGKKICEN